MHQTYKEIIQDCIAEALCLPRDPISVELRDLALASLNEQAEIIWFRWKWDNEKIDEFEAPAADEDGIITFAETVESIMAIRKVEEGETEGTGIWPEDEYLAAMSGNTVSSDKFQHLAADSDLNRRILVPVPTDGSTVTYRVLGLRKFTRAIVDADYDEADPTATPTDYRVLTFPIDRALSALRAEVKDSLRRAQNIPTEKRGKELLDMALDRETFDNAKDRRVVPQSPMFSDVGNW